MAQWAKYLNKGTAGAIPPVIPGCIGTYLGFGICKYTPLVLAYAMTGSAQLLGYYQVPRPHRIIRVQMSQSVISSGAPDTTGISATWQKTDYYLGGNGDIQDSTNGNQTVATVIFEFDSKGWVNDGSIYILGVTGQSGDQLTVEFYVQYLLEPDEDVCAGDRGA